MASESKSKSNNNTNTNKNTTKRKQRYLPYNRNEKKGSYPLRPGVQGFFITCDGGRERQASHESINVINSSRYDLEEEMCNAQKRGSGGSSSKMHTDAQNCPFERSSSNRQQWREVWRSHGNSQPNLEAQKQLDGADSHDNCWLGLPEKSWRF